MHHPSQFNELQTAQANQSKSSSLQEQLLVHQLLVIVLRKEVWKGPREHTSLTDAVTHCIAADMLPISIVDNDGFCELVSKLNPRYDIL